MKFTSISLVLACLGSAMAADVVRGGSQSRRRELKPGDSKKGEDGVRIYIPNVSLVFCTTNHLRV
jgi:hypothetical protein